MEPKRGELQAVSQNAARKALWRMVLKRGWVTEAEVLAAVGGDSEARTQLLLSLRLAQVEIRPDVGAEAA